MQVGWCALNKIRKNKKQFRYSVILFQNQNGITEYPKTKKWVDFNQGTLCSLVISFQNKIRKTKKRFHYFVILFQKQNGITEYPKTKKWVDFVFIVSFWLIWNSAGTTPCGSAPPLWLRPLASPTPPGQLVSIFRHFPHFPWRAASEEEDYWTVMKVCINTSFHTLH